MLGDKKMQHAWMKYAEFNDIPHDHEDEEPFKQGFAMGRTDSDQSAELAALKAKLAALVVAIDVEYADPNNYDRYMPMQTEIAMHVAREAIIDGMEVRCR